MGDSENIATADERATAEFATLSVGPRGERLQERFELAMDAWDEHMRACPECLTYGEHLCAEGEFRREDLESSRLRIESFRTAAMQRTTSGIASRRPSGVSA